MVTSPFFTFLVGAERTAIILHNFLVSSHSSALNALMNGAMSEAEACRAELPDVNTATFVCFSQCLYTGHYDMPYRDGGSRMRLEVIFLGTTIFPSLKGGERKKR